MDSSNEWSNHDDKVDVIKFILKENGEFNCYFDIAELRISFS